MINSPTRTFLLSSTAAVVLAGCAGADDKYPSLAIRDAERVMGQFSPAAPAVPQETAPQTLLQLEGYVEQAQGAHQRFTAARPGASSLVMASRSLGIDSDTRSRALVALAELTSLRGETAIALSEIDRLVYNAKSAFAAVEDVEAAQAQVEQLVTEQDAVIDSLSVGLSL